MSHHVDQLLEKKNQINRPNDDNDNRLGGKGERGPSR